MSDNLQITDTTATTGCGCGTAESTTTITPAAATLTLQVTGLSCGGCATKVTRALTALPGVSDVQVDLNPEGPATVSVAGAVDPETTRRTITDTGYTVLN